jgi:sialic acid synthase SpsE
VKAGEPLTEANVRSVRPAAGLHTRHLPEVLGRRVRQDTPLGTPLTWDLLEPLGPVGGSD